MRELGLFPLPLVLLPGERIPLHVFEPRYRELIAECLEQRRSFGVLLSEEESLREVGTEASVVEVLEQTEDGRSTILVEGGSRFRLSELTAGRSFRTGLAEPFADEREDEPEQELVDRTMELFRRLAALTETDIDELLEEGIEPRAFSIAAHVELELERKQELLELRSERERMELLASLLERAALAISHMREQRQRASGNGRLGGPSGAPPLQDE
ncbi:MAG: LON peptidase substrate-binding domain-containing protein [Gaiellaceae bacterium]